MDYVTIGISVALSVLISWSIATSKTEKLHRYKRKCQRYRVSRYINNLDGFILLVDRRIKYSVNKFLNHCIEELDQIINLSVEYSHVLDYHTEIPNPNGLIGCYFYIVSEAIKARVDGSISNETLIIDLLKDEDENNEFKTFSGINYDDIEQAKNIISSQINSILAFDDELKKLINIPTK